ncbi:lin0512 family protein [Nitzschia inconspicua]|uniref:Lin0512 family protein n=1 Tax=Nitzschia inconspicua TaxID=303405 RepID=A0A9K3KNB0_9STRA|nr:lin0512 family protein [Nitzschia inconspicua]
MMTSSSSSSAPPPTTTTSWPRHEGDPHVETVLFVECGWGNDSHGQNVTKAAVRACRNAIEFNSIPSVRRLVPNGYDGLRLDVVLAVPAKYRDGLDLEAVSQVFPYGSIRYQLQDGGMIAPSGIAIERLGDSNEDMVVVCAAVTVGY